MVPFLHITSRVATDKYQNLLSEKGGGGFPYIAFLGDDGRMLAAQSYAALNIAGFTKTLEGEVQEFLDLEKNAADGDAAAAKKLFAKQVELGHLDNKQMRAALKRKDVSKEVKDKLRDKLASSEVEATLKGINFRQVDKFGTYAKKLLAIHKEFGLPSSAISGWYVILEDSFARKDVKTFKMALAAMKASGSVRPRFLEAQAKRLAQLEGGKGKK